MHIVGMERNMSKEADVRTSLAQYPVPTFDWYNVAQATIDILPDVALLMIFDFYLDQYPGMPVWYTLVHVCRKWRNVVFGSPRRLNLRLWCNESTPVRERLDVWPHLPIAIVGDGEGRWGVNNLIAALEHNDRICQINIWPVSSLQMEKVLAAMQQPFPALTHLDLMAKGGTAAVIPASFLGGSAPALQELDLDFISFPGLRKLLLSATHLVRLKLCDIPYSGYISPEAMVICLSALTRLETLNIGFESPRSRPDRITRRPPPLTRILLPALGSLWFSGVSEYLEDFVARIDAPLLKKLEMTFFHQLIFDIPQLTQFIGRTSQFKTYDNLRVLFSGGIVWVTLGRTFVEELEYRILCSRSDWLLSSMAQLCSSFFRQALFPALEHLYIMEDGLSDWQDDIESSQWLEVLHPFTAVKDFYISSILIPRIAPALQELVGERVTEVLPALQTLFLEEPLPSGPVQEAIGQFVAARQLSGHPIVVSRWDCDG
jgi:hypothetical protein